MRLRACFLLVLWSFALYAQSDSAVADHLRSGQASRICCLRSFSLGLSDLKLGKFSEAVPVLQDAAKLDPNNIEAARGLLTCDVNLGKYGQAFRQLQLFTNQTDEQSLFVAGQAYLDVGKSLTTKLALKVPRFNLGPPTGG